MENLDQVYMWIVQNGIKLVGAVVVLVVGFWIVKVFVRQMVRLMKKRNVDAGLVSFSRSLLSVLLKIMIVISVMGMVGVEMTSFIAVLGAAGLAVGLAFQGTLSNFAGGVIILLFKPFKVGEFIDGQGHAGTVKEIQIFNTVLTTPDNKVVFIPNGGLATGSLTNFSRQETRRVDWKIGVAYGEDYKKVREIILNILNADNRVLKDPEVFIGLGEMADSSVNIIVRAWTITSDYWSVSFDVNEKIYETFNKEGIEIPFPQMDVHIKQ
ncbi:MAG: mechanosensitive ion channel [Bacteroidales bacterium]|nr:mechanosensitive ion channel [Bacteroidales bacterium]MDD2387509.1 mechanosensitive ion channel [Bacteroidales bacterium]MDD4216743.1 mechanosensitive ion channel [Bacteroidales bacterium]MDY0140412.1 mechanosensitive ion channel [Bacteroidales bacterium]